MSEEADGEVTVEEVSQADAVTEPESGEEVSTSPVEEKSDPIEGIEAGIEAENRRLEEARARLLETRRLRQETERQIGETTQTGQQNTEVIGEPTIDQYEDYDKFIVAKAKYEIEQEQQQKAQVYREQQRRMKYQESLQTFHQRADSVREKHKDYDEVLQRAYIPEGSAIEQAILSSDKGPDIAYYLGNNPAEAQRIASLNPVQAVFELAEIKAKISAPPKPSNAPDPIPPIDHGKTVVEVEDGPEGAVFE